MISRRRLLAFSASLGFGGLVLGPSSAQACGGRVSSGPAAETWLLPGDKRVITSEARAQVMDLFLEAIDSDGRVAQAFESKWGIPGNGY